MQVQDCLFGIFSILGIDSSTSLLQQQEIDQMLYLGEAPRRWTRPRNFSARASYEDPCVIPTCCSPWHNGSNHVVSFYLCPEYWTILDLLKPAKNGYLTQEHTSKEPSRNPMLPGDSHPQPFPPKGGCTGSSSRTTALFPHGHAAPSPRALPFTSS